MFLSLNLAVGTELKHLQEKVRPLNLLIVCRLFVFLINMIKQDCNFLFKHNTVLFPLLFCFPVIQQAQGQGFTQNVTCPLEIKYFMGSLGFEPAYQNGK